MTTDVYTKQIEPDMPALNVISDSFVMVADFESFRDECSNSKLDTSTIIQHYVPPFGGKHCLVRFVYHNPVCNLTGAKNYSMNLASIYRIDQKFAKSSKRNLENKCTFQFDKRNSFDLYVCNKGGAKQREYERIAETLSNLITKRFKFRVSKIVLDFVQDEKRTIYLTWVPAFFIDPNDRVLQIDKAIGNTYHHY